MFKGGVFVSGLGNKEIFSKNLKRIMEDRGIERTTLCEKLNFKYSTFSDWYNGNKYPRIDKIEMLANYFGIQKSDLIEDETTLPPGATAYNPTHKIPILGYISAGLPLYAEQHIEGYTYTELNGGAEYFALKVKGDSMNAANILDGALLIVRRQESVENGEIAVVMVNGENATVKRFRRENDMAILEPKSTNPIHQTQVYNLKTTNIKIIGKVIEVKYQIQ